MQQRYPVLSAGSEVLPITNGTYQTDSQDTAQANNCQVYFQFFSDAAGTIPVTPTGGTIVVSASPIGSANFLAPSNSATINATACGTPNSTYTPPYFLGRISVGQVVFSGITGALTARVLFWRY